MQAEGDKVVQSIKSGDWLKDPSLLTRFLVLSYADLKKFDFYYCFGFPAPLYENASLLVDGGAAPLNATALAEATKDRADLDLSFCVFKWTEEQFVYKPLTDLIGHGDLSADDDLASIFFAFSDPSTNEKPGWPLRVFIAALLHSW